MSARKKPHQRCPKCLMRLEACICSEIPRLELSTKIIFIIGKREFKVPTNTGRLAAAALPNSVVLIHGDLDKSYNLQEHLNPDGANFLLYPHDEAQVITSDFVKAMKTPSTIVIPDGSWRRTSKMRRRDIVMKELPMVKLAPGLPSLYRVRKEMKNEGLATIEAAARAIGMLESAQAQSSLESLLNLMVARTLESRGINSSFPS